jgi:hypothetical protein
MWNLDRKNKPPAPHPNLESLGASTNVNANAMNNVHCIQVTVGFTDMRKMHGICSTYPLSKHGCQTHADSWFPHVDLMRVSVNGDY